MKSHNYKDYIDNENKDDGYSEGQTYTYIYIYIVITTK